VARRIQETPLQILCEGADDAEFFTRLAHARGLNQYHVECPKGEDKRPLGKGGFARHLDLMKQGIPSGVPLKGILVVADSDEDPVVAFREVQQSIRSSGLRVPDNPLEIMTNHSGFPAIAVMMVPWHDRRGNLERVVFDALIQIVPHLNPCLETFRDCCGAQDRTESLQAKMLLRCLIAALNPQDPSATLTNFLKAPVEFCPIDYSHAAFSQMADFLTTFSQRMIGGLAAAVNQ
jgi:uncharacterized protein DUF3226